MVDLAELARQMKAIGRKGSGKDYYEQYVAQGIAKYTVPSRVNIRLFHSTSYRSRPELPRRRKRNQCIRAAAYAVL